MNKTALVITLFFFCFVFAQAQNENIFRYPLSPRTMDAFSAACARISQYQLIKGRFEQEKTLSRLNRVLKSSGNFIITSNMGMVWDTIIPVPTTLTLGRDFLIQSRPGGQRTLLSAQGNETFLRMAQVISTVFSGNSAGLLDNFEVYFSGGADSWEMGLIPKNNAINSFAERIILKGDTVIRSIQIAEQNGDSIKYILSDHIFPPALNANEQAFFTLP